MAVTPAASSGLAAVQGVVFDVQRYSLHDGPGVRTNVFLKGCPLHCPWCANPESQARQPEPMLRAAHCIDCDLFSSEGEASVPCTACWPAWQQAHHNGSTRADIDARVAVWPPGALTWVGVRPTAREVVAEVMRARVFYGAGGGLTLTGGEPAMQPEFCQALLVLAKQSGLATAMETCGYAPWAVFERLLPYLDVVLFDVKHVDAERHRQRPCGDVIEKSIPRNGLRFQQRTRETALGLVEGNEVCSLRKALGGGSFGEKTRGRKTGGFT